MTDTHEVIRKGFYRRVNGKLISLPVGTKVQLTEAQGARMTKNGIVKPLAVNSAPTVKEVEKPAEDKDDTKPVVKQQPKKTSKRRRSKG